MGKTAEKCGFLRIQKYPLRQCGKRNCRLLIITDAAARCNNHRLCFCIMGKPVSCRSARAMPNQGALGQRGCLGGVQRGESRLTAELPRRTAGTLRKDAIGVEKKTMQPRGEELSYRRFSRMAETQQHDRSRRSGAGRYRMFQWFSVNTKIQTVLTRYAKRSTDELDAEKDSPAQAASKTATAFSAF